MSKPSLENNSLRRRSYPLSRGGIALRLDCVSRGERTEKQILLTHGVTYSSHEFDVDYKDYSLVRCLAGAGYGVWRLDVAGYGLSGAVDDGFLPDSDYAAEDIRAAVELIVTETGREKIDLLGWSWGTVTAGRYAARHPEHLRRLVLYAPILTGIGAAEIPEPFHRNSRAHAAEDFQQAADGLPDPAITDPVVVDLFCSGCTRFDGEYSPNAGRRDICVDPSIDLIPLEQIAAPTLILCGDRDPYLNYERLGDSLRRLPRGSALEIIPGGGHVLMLEAPYHQEFQRKLLRFLR